MQFVFLKLLSGKIPMHLHKQKGWTPKWEMGEVIEHSCTMINNFLSTVRSEAHKNANKKHKVLAIAVIKPSLTKSHKITFNFRELQAM